MLLECIAFCFGAASVGHLNLVSWLCWTPCADSDGTTIRRNARRVGSRTSCGPQSLAVKRCLVGIQRQDESLTHTYFNYPNDCREECAPQSTVPRPNQCRHCP
jgi:hypothetical protein